MTSGEGRCKRCQYWRRAQVGACYGTCLHKRIAYASAEQWTPSDDGAGKYVTMPNDGAYYMDSD
jgi:hypothetical protein